MKQRERTRGAFLGGHNKNLGDKYRRDMDDLAEFRAKAAQCAHLHRTPIMCADCGTLKHALPPLEEKP